VNFQIKMELLKFFLLVIILITFVIAHPAPDANPANRLKSGAHKKNRPAAPKGAAPVLPVLNRARRQFGYGGSNSFANANAFASSNNFGGSPYGFSPYGGGFGGGSSFASAAANANSGSFGR